MWIKKKEYKQLIRTLRYQEHQIKQLWKASQEHYKDLLMLADAIGLKKYYVPERKGQTILVRK